MPDLSADQRLAETIRLLKSLPVMSAASDIEPWAKVHLIDITKAIEVAEGLSDPADWVSVYCGKSFGHSPHHWSRYRADSVPLREPNWCDGEVCQPTD
jgi:hypothetical protein